MIKIDHLVDTRNYIGHIIFFPVFPDTQRSQKRVVEIDDEDEDPHAKMKADSTFCVNYCPKMSDAEKELESRDCHKASKDLTEAYNNHRLTRKLQRHVARGDVSIREQWEQFTWLQYVSKTD